MSRLLEYLPPYEQESRVFQEIMQAEERQFHKLGVDIDDLKKQFFIDTATWGLEIYEKELGIKTDFNKHIEERRNVVRSKWRGSGKVNAFLIKVIIEAHTKSSVQVNFDGRIKIKFCNNESLYINLESVFNSIDDVKPSHLAADITIDYKQKESNIYFGACLLSGEEITVYPYSPRDIESKGKVYIGIGSNTGLESTTIYPRKDVV